MSPDGRDPDGRDPDGRDPDATAPAGNGSALRTWQLQDALETMTPETEAQEIAALPPPLRDEFEHVVEDAMFSGQRHTLTVLLGLVGLCFGMSLLLRTRVPGTRR